MSSICIIPARGGSRRIPRKNIRPFHGKPIMAYSIEAAKVSGLFDRIIVSSDDLEILDTAVHYGAEPFDRPPELARDDVGTYDVTRETFMALDGWRDVGRVCCIYATAPMLDITDLQLGRHYLERKPMGHVISACYPHTYDAAQFYWSHAMSLVHRENYFGPGTTLLPVMPERVCDINTPKDFHQALIMYSMLHNVPVNMEEIIK